MIEDRGEIFPSLEINPANPAIQLLANTHKEIVGQEAIIDVSPTVTDGGWLGDAGIPTVIYGPGDLLNAHSVNEQVSIKQLVEYTKTLMKFIHEWTNQIRRGA